MRSLLERAKRVVVVEKSLAVGVGGIVSTNVRTTVSARSVPVYDVIAGLGGRPITKGSLARVFTDAMNDELKLTTFLDLDAPLIERVLAAEAELRRSGPLPERVLKERHGIPAR
jgi:pyruvate ferredoxin oxidoreductase alpha subunit